MDDWAVGFKTVGGHPLDVVGESRNVEAEVEGESVCFDPVVIRGSPGDVVILERMQYLGTKKNWQTIAEKIGKKMGEKEQGVLSEIELTEEQTDIKYCRNLKTCSERN